MFLLVLALAGCLLIVWFAMLSYYDRSRRLERAIFDHYLSKMARPGAPNPSDRWLWEAAGMIEPGEWRDLN